MHFNTVVVVICVLNKLFIPYGCLVPKWRIHHVGIGSSRRRILSGGADGRCMAHEMPLAS